MWFQSVATGQWGEIFSEVAFWFKHETLSFCFPNFHTLHLNISLTYVGLVLISFAKWSTNWNNPRPWQMQGCRPWGWRVCHQMLADHLTLFQPGGTDYAHLITIGTPGFSDLPTALFSEDNHLLSFDKKGSLLFIFFPIKNRCTYSHTRIKRKYFSCLASVGAHCLCTVQSSYQPVRNLPQQ